jgi:hypothetical protein
MAATSVGGHISADGHLRIKVLTDFADILLKKQVNYQARWDQLFRVIPTNLRYVEEALWESVPIPNLWQYGEGRTRKSVKDIYLTLYHYNWELSLEWLRWDEEDISNNDKMQRLLEAQAERFIQLPDIFVAEYLSATADKYPALANAYDGVALHSATDGDGAARFGVTGGNIITGNGVANPAAIKKDLFAAKRRLTEFLDTQDQPYFQPEECSIDKFTVVHSPALIDVMETTRDAKYTYIETGINTAASNIVQQKFDTWPNQRLSGNDWYIIVKHPYLKPFVKVDRDTMEQQLEDESNSDYSRDTGSRSSLCHQRFGIAPFAPQSTIHVNN